MSAGPRSARLAVGLVLGLFAAACDDDRQCIQTERQQVATYPNAGLMALGPSYTAIALAPVFVEQDVCVKREGD